MKKLLSIDARMSSEDRIGRQLAARLDTSLQDLPHDISERLRVARLQALDKYRQTVPVRALHALPVGGGAAALQGGGGEEFSLWPRLVSLLPLLALVSGLVAFQMLGNDDVAEELAEIDTAILTDDLPPDAYADPGFAEFLKSRMEQFNRN